MGGIGSGRPERYDAKATCEASFALDIRALERAGRLQPGTLSLLRPEKGRSGGPPQWRESVLLLITDEGVMLFLGAFVFNPPLTQIIKKCESPGTKGGARWWWECPLCQCRAAVLYSKDRSVPFGFACRTCHGLTYQSCSDNEFERLRARASAIRRRLSDDPMYQTGPCYHAPHTFFPPKPPGMHWKTYYALRDELMECERGALQFCAAETSLQIKQMQQIQKRLKERAAEQAEKQGEE